MRDANYEISPNNLVVEGNNRMLRLSSKGWKITILTLSFSIILYSSHTLWLSFFGAFLVINDNLEKSDVIIVLGTHPKGARVDWAGKLYQRRLADKIILCGYQVGWKTSTGNIMKNQALHLGIPEDAIFVDQGNYNTGTWDNAFSALKIVRENNFKTAIVVTSNYHTRRARLTFNKVFKDTDVKILISPCPGGSFAPGEWWKNRGFIESVFLEYVKLVYYMLFPPQLRQEKDT